MAQRRRLRSNTMGDVQDARAFAVPPSEESPQVVMPTIDAGEGEVLSSSVRATVTSHADPPTTPRTKISTDSSASSPAESSSGAAATGGGNLPSLDDVFGALPKISLPISRAQEALDKNDTAAFNELIESKLVDINGVAENGDSVLMMAIATRKVTLVSHVLSKNADVNYVRAADGLSPILSAAASGSVEILQLLQKNGANIKQKKKNGATALMLAAKSGRSDAVTWCHQEGVALNDTTDSGITALMLAAQDGMVDIVRYLVQEGASPNVANAEGITALMLAVQNGHVAVVKDLIPHIANLDAATPKGMTAVLYAAKEGHHLILDALLNAGASSNCAILSSKATPLMIAARQGHLSVVQTLVRRRVEVDQHDLNGYTALAFACKYARTEIVSLLLASGARGDLVLGDGKTPAELAAEAGIDYIFRMGACDPLSQKDLC